MLWQPKSEPKLDTIDNQRDTRTCAEHSASEASLDRNTYIMTKSHALGQMDNEKKPQNNYKPEHNVPTWTICKQLSSLHHKEWFSLPDSKFQNNQQIQWFESQNWIWLLMWMQIQAHSAKSFSHHLNLSCNACKASSIGILLAWGPACAVNAQQCGKWSHEDGVNRVHERLQPGH